MAVEFIIKKNEYDKELKTPHVSIHETDHLSLKGRFFVTLVEKWGMVSAADAGEDSSGKQKIKCMPVDEVIDRADQMTQKAFERMGQYTDMLLQMPTMDEMKQQLESEKETETA